MIRKKMIKIILITSLFLISLGGVLLHSRIHPVTKNTANVIPLFLGLAGVFFIPFLFWFKRTLNLAYIANGFSAIIGTITMAHYSIAHSQSGSSLSNIILNSLFADIAILWGKFALGQALFSLEFLKTETDIVITKGRFLCYPNMGWWWVHLFALAIVYVLGNILWK